MSTEILQEKTVNSELTHLWNRSDDATRENYLIILWFCLTIINGDNIFYVISGLSSNN